MRDKRVHHLYDRNIIQNKLELEIAVFPPGHAKSFVKTPYPLKRFPGAGAVSGDEFGGGKLRDISFVISRLSGQWNQGRSGESDFFSTLFLTGCPHRA